MYRMTKIPIPLFEKKLLLLMLSFLLIYYQPNCIYPIISSNVLWRNGISSLTVLLLRHHLMHLSLSDDCSGLECSNIVFNLSHYFPLTLLPSLCYLSCVYPFALFLYPFLLISEPVDPPAILHFYTLLLNLCQIVNAPTNYWVSSTRNRNWKKKQY